MTAILAAALLLPWPEPTPGLYLDGKATYYAPRLMETVASNRGMALADAVDFVALNRAGDLGRLVWLEYRGAVTGPYRVVDCAQEGAHYEERERRGLIVEVSFQRAMAWHMIRPVPIRVLFFPPDPPGAF